MPANGDRNSYYLLGNFEFDVNFDSGDLTNGSLHDMSINGVLYDGAFLFEDTTINEGAFSTTLSVDQSMCAPYCDILTLGLLDGAFYGPNAEETGGVFAIEGVSDDDEGFVIIGSFAGWD